MPQKAPPSIRPKPGRLCFGEGIVLGQGKLVQGRPRAAAESPLALRAFPPFTKGAFRSGPAVQAPLKRGLSPPAGGDWGFLRSRDEKPSVICSANATSLFKGGFLRGARRPGVRSAPAVHDTYFCRGGSQTRPSHLHPWAPVYLFHGDVSPPRRRPTLPTAAKWAKRRLRGRCFDSSPP